MNCITCWLDGPADGIKVTIDATAVIATIILILLGIVAYFAREWATGIRAELALIHADMKAHNDKSEATHGTLFEKVNKAVNRVAKIEGQLGVEGEED